jgi:uncharacterized protein (TIGR04255 family)
MSEHEEMRPALEYLVEAIFELRWELSQSGSPELPRVDPMYNLATGAFFTRLQDEDKYPFHEQLPSAILPDPVSAYVVQHQFRAKQHGWPLVQLGQGILTVNDVVGYAWGDFGPRVTRAVATLFGTYKALGGNLQVSGLTLRYINAVPFDFLKKDVFSFLEKMGVGISLGSDLKTRLSNQNPDAIDLNFEFQMQHPEDGSTAIHFFRGQRKDGPSSLMWETIVRSTGQGMPCGTEEITKWIGTAHDFVKALFEALTARIPAAEEGD